MHGWGSDASNGLFAGNPNIAKFEDDCASNFVEATQFLVYHYCRALAMKAVALARVQKFGDACSVLEKMKALYNPELHTAAIAEVSEIHQRIHKM